MMNIYLLSLACFLARASSAAVDPFIIGGGEASAGEWPWNIQVYENDAFKCGASIIGPNTAITTADCVLTGKPENFVVVAGTIQLTNKCTPDTCVTRTLSEIKKHPGFTGSTQDGYPNDIAVIRWKDAIKEVTGKVNIKYGQRSKEVNDPVTTCYIVGWGAVKAPNQQPKTLQEAEVGTMPRDQCSKKLSGVKVSEKQVCVFDKDSLKNVCRGDAGSPLQCLTKDKKWELVGFSSWAVQGCLTSYPSVYTRISAYNDWIDSQLNE